MASHERRKENTGIRNLNRACDSCRVRKIKCDGNDMPNRRCTDCILIEEECTYLQPAPKRSPPKRYIEGLEKQAKQMENLLLKLYPDGDYLEHLDASDAKPLPKKNSECDETLYKKDPSAVYMAITTNIHEINGDDTHLDEQDSDDMAHIELNDAIQRLNIGVGNVFLGKSSGAMLLRDAFGAKAKFLQEASGVKAKFWEEAPAENQKGIPPLANASRPLFWTRPPWEAPFLRGPTVYIFPEPDLLQSLVDLYFIHTNTYFPLLHRPTFNRQIYENLHLSNDDFAMIVLIVAAIGARLSDDPRVYSKGQTSPYSRGWLWYSQVEYPKTTALTSFSLYKLQHMALAALFLLGSSVPHVAWTMTGVGLCVAQDLGAHRRKKNGYKPTMEDELSKRAFWVLVALDRLLSTSLGRPCSIRNEDFDVEYPITVDNDELSEFLAHPEKRSTKPSSMHFFVCMLDLLEIQAVAVRTIYSINKSKILLGAFSHAEWDQHIVSQLDSALNKWLSTIPAHLVWDPDRDLGTFFSQSTLLYCLYYDLQMVIHRPFISTAKRIPSCTFPSLAICTNAARSCSNVLDNYLRRTNTAIEYAMNPAFTSAIVLLWNIWTDKEPKHSHSRDKADLSKCMKAVKSCEELWSCASQMYDILERLASSRDTLRAGCKDPFMYARGASDDSLSPDFSQHSHSAESASSAESDRELYMLFGASSSSWPEDFSFGSQMCNIFSVPLGHLDGVGHSSVLPAPITIPAETSFSLEE